MKMIMAIVNSDDSNAVVQNLMKSHFSATRLASSGGFLRAGNVTILVGVEDDKVQEVIDIIQKYSKSRRQMIPTAAEVGMNFYPTMPVEIMVGGATIFVLNVDRFEKV
jgi:uncharacterized protein YaaQ